MKVIIQQQEYEYLSDYNDGWRFSSSDDFKFPVTIGRYPCFIKRFARNPEKVTGWRLLQAIRATSQPGLPTVHDIVQTEENNVSVRYLFTECMEGDTLDNLIKEGWKPDPGLLTKDILKALGSLHKQEHWMSDFCERNIFCRKDRGFFLIDLDSAHPTAIRPDNEMYGNKDYWALVFSYLQDRVGMKGMRPDDCQGPVLNYLQLIFLVLRMRAGLEKGVQEFKSPELFERLPAMLDNTAPELRQLFKGLVQSGVDVPSAQDIQEMTEILMTKIVEGKLGTGDNIEPLPSNNGNKVHEAPPPMLPFIRSFTCDKRRLSKGGPFTLSWQAYQGESIAVYRNGLPYKPVAKGLGAVTLSERYDGKTKKILFTLVVSNSEGMVNSQPLAVHVGPVPVRPYLLAAAGVVVLALMVVLAVKAVYWLRRTKPETQAVVVPPKLPDSTATKKDTVNWQKRRQDSLNAVQAAKIAAYQRYNDSVKNAHKAVKTKPDETKDQARVPVPVVAEPTRPPVVDPEAGERERLRTRMAVRRRVMEDSVTVMDTVLTGKKWVVLTSHKHVLGFNNRSGFFIDTLEVEIRPAGGGEATKRKFYSVPAKTFSVLTKDLPKGKIEVSVKSVIF